MPSINTNMAAITSVRSINDISSESTSVLEKMASGSNINSASDDASGLAILTSMETDEVAWEQAGENADVAVSILETADGGAGEIADILQRMYSLASESNSGTVTDTERAYLDAEYQLLEAEIDAIATATTYNGDSLLDGTGDYASGVDFQVGVNSADTITVTVNALDVAALGLTAATSADDILTQTEAASVLTVLEAAIETVSSERASIGATMSRFEYRSSMIDTALENLESAQSTVSDADVAELSAQQTTLGVQSDAAINALSVANENLEKLSRLMS